MLKSPFAAVLFAAAVSFAATTPGLSQTAPVAPKIYDADGRLVGTVFPPGPFPKMSRVLMSFDKGEALLDISYFYGFAVVTSDLPDYPLSERLDPAFYYASRDCSGPAYIRLVHFPNYALPEWLSFSAQGGLWYASRPFTAVDLFATKTGDRCAVLSRPLISAKVGVAAMATLPNYKRPFTTR